MKKTNKNKLSACETSSGVEHEEDELKCYILFLYLQRMTILQAGYHLQFQAVCRGDNDPNNDLCER